MGSLDKKKNYKKIAKEVIDLEIKALKKLKTSIDSSFNEAIEADESNATVYYEYGMYAYQSGLDYYETYPNPSMGDKSFQKAEEMFAIALDKCSNYHANCAYYLGVINYTQKDMPSAIKWFKEFKAFKNDNQIFAT